MMKRVMPSTHAQETGTRNMHEKFDSSSSQFLAPKQLSGQSRCTVRLTCLTVSMPEQSCVQLCARNLYQKNWNQIVQHTRASFWYQTTGTSFWSVCCWHKLQLQTKGVGNTGARGVRPRNAETAGANVSFLRPPPTICQVYHRATHSFS